jgi:hypothetical protein
MPVSITTSSTTTTVSVAETATNVTTSSTTTNQRNPLESIPESGEIPNPAHQSTAITDNTSNSLCLATERSSRSSRNKR